MTIVLRRLDQELRPSRLNHEGWCRYCFESGCASAACIAVHAASEWERCRVCGGSGFGGRFDQLPCRVCETEGLALIDAPGIVGSAAAEAVLRQYCDRVFGREPVMVVAPVESRRGRVRVIETGSPRPAGWLPGCGL
ncbi:hypothetical protein [Nocardia abscessus]|uniref:hypothetical protein n=1 Tax=Nocardia abscessus TaxID=120957 RepID=UPI002453F166|nr:hypothetical protein [Nocardia abscessus]